MVQRMLTIIVDVNFLESNRDRYIIVNYVRVFEFLYSNFTFTLTNKEIF